MNARTPRRTRTLAIMLGYLALFATAAHACLWDYDTLRAEAQGLPGVVEIITGRFDRFPPLYYEMRLERVEREVVDRPDDLDLYDGAGVALDRLGRGDEAIAWMTRKLEAMDRLEAEGADLGDHRYRYLANLGTFHVHRWLRSGADREDMTDVERARELIAAAIERNPDAHFGRERYQLLAIEWLLDPVEPDERVRGNSIFGADDQLRGKSLLFPDHKLPEAGYEDAVAGLAGLIVLGDAWESVDIFQSLRVALSDRGDASVAMLAALRVEELRRNWQESLKPSPNPEDRALREPGIFVFDEQEASIEAFFQDARSEAEAWRTDRHVYMSESLGRGEHPDTHPEFWADWVEVSSPPATPNGTLGLVALEDQLLAGGLVCAGVGTLLILVVIALVWRRKARRAISGGPQVV